MPKVVNLQTNKKHKVQVVEDDILYDMTTDELIILDSSTCSQFQDDIAKLQEFDPFIKASLPEDGDKPATSKEKAARLKATIHFMSEFTKVDDPDKEKLILQDLDNKIKKKIDEIIAADDRASANTANGGGLKEGHVKEILWFREKRVVRTKAGAVKAHNRTFSRKQVEQQVKKELRDQKKENKKQGMKPVREEEIKLFEKKLYDKNGHLFKAAKEFSDECNWNYFEDCDVLEAGIGAQFMRYSADVKGELKCDWKNNKTIQLSGKASGSFALAQAQGHFDVSVPDENGLDIIEVIRSFDNNLIDKGTPPLLVMLQVKFGGSAFVGLCGSIGLDAGISLKDPLAKDGEPLKAQAGLDLFAGAKTQADVTLSAQMKLVDDVNTNVNAVAWTEMSSFQYFAWAAAGVGLTAYIKAGYWKERFRFEAKVGVVLKLGAGTGIKFSIAPIDIGKFIWTLGVALNWTHMGKVLTGKMHDLYQCIMMNCFYLGQTIAETTGEIIEHVKELMDDAIDNVQDKLEDFKTIDDAFDEYVPGYSGFKKFNAGFWLLKSSYNKISAYQKKDIREATIALVKSKNSQDWKYATWQIKLNLISDMCTKSAGYGGMSQEDKEDAIMIVLRNVKTSHELNKIISGLSKDGNNLDTELDFKQQSEYDRIKAKFGVK